MSRSRWVAPALWAVLIELLTSWPQPPTFGAPEHSDKVAHVGMFAVFAFLVIRAAQVGRPSVRAMAVTLLALVVWAALDEWHQKFIPGREGGVADWIADSIGVVLGLGIRWMKPQRVSPGTR